MSFSDGRALCLLLHHYHPTFVAMADINMDTTQQQQQQKARNMDDSLNDSFGEKDFFFMIEVRVFTS